MIIYFLLTPNQESGKGHGVEDDEEFTMTFWFKTSAYQAGFILGQKESSGEPEGSFGLSIHGAPYSHALGRMPSLLTLSISWTRPKRFHSL